MAGLSSEYKQALILLLPRGLTDFWEQLDSTSHAILTAFAQEIARIVKSIEELPAEESPRTAVRTLQRWERFLGLSAGALTLAQRREAIELVLILGFGRPSLLDLIKLFELEGVSIRRDAYPGVMAGERVGERAANLAMKHVVFIDNLPNNERATQFKAAVARAGAAHLQIIYT